MEQNFEQKPSDNKNSNLFSPKEIVNSRLKQYRRYVERCNERKNYLSSESAQTQAQIAAIIVGFLSLDLKNISEMPIMWVKILWFAIILLLIVSMYFGLKNIKVKCMFFNDMADNCSKVINIWLGCSDRKYDTDTAKYLTDEIIKPGRHDSSDIPETTQKKWLLCGVFLFIAYILIRVFFKIN